MTGPETAIRDAWWPLADLGEGIQAMAAMAGAPPVEDCGLPPVAIDVLPEWIGHAAERLGLEGVPVHATVGDLPRFLACGGPAVILHRLEGRPGFLLLADSRRRTVTFRGPNRHRIAFRRDAVLALLIHDQAGPVRPEVDRVLDAAGVHSRRRLRVADAMVRERIAGAVVDGITLLRLPATADFAGQLRQAAIPARLARIVAIFAVVYAAEIWGWSLIGGATLTGRLDHGWLTAWLLLLVTTLPWQWLGTWCEATFALDIGRLLKSRLLAGALALPPDAVKRSGVGQVIGQVMESEALESLALGGGMAVVVAVLELGFAGWILSLGAAPGPHLVLLVSWSVATIALGWRYHRRISRWTGRRLTMTHYLVEAMVGHRTRLAQERPDRRDAAEDAQLASYLDRSAAMDGHAVAVATGLGSGWMVAALLAFAPVLVSGHGATPSALAISLGGMIMAQRALAAITGGLASLSRAGFAWRRIATMFGAARDGQSPGATLSTDLATPAQGPILEARGIDFAYSATGAKVLRNADLTIHRGDRILVEGPSGGGKSTLAAVLTGLRRPDAGLLLLGGLDRPTVGENWHGQVTAAPQFHENHILSGTLAFNLLMGRQWPPSAGDLAEAEALCADLGLGDLIARMPGGLHQRVGETGWQLSHGERSRIFLARALLQRAQVTILDESFAALDPATLDLCLNAALTHAETLVVIAHP